MENELENLVKFLSEEFKVKYNISETSIGTKYVVFENYGLYYATDLEKFKNNRYLGSIVSNLAFSLGVYDELGRAVRNYYRLKNESPGED